MRRRERAAHGSSARESSAPGTILVAHPSADLYGSDLQLVESVAGLVAAGWRVVVALPTEGPLEARLLGVGAAVERVPVPVLRKALLRPLGLIGLFARSAAALPRMLRLVGGLRPDLLYVNTVTVPLWLVAGILARRRSLCHVHEAEQAGRWLSRLLNAPLLMARTVVVNSHAAADVLVAAVPALRRRLHVVHNGVPGPPVPLAPAARGEGSARRVVVVGRLSPRKGTDVAVEAVALLRAEGRDVTLDLCGSVFPGYEWFEHELRERITAGQLEDHIRLLGYRSPTWPALEEAEVVLVPSRAEPFGNVAVEGQLAGRPVIASDVQGLREIIHPGTGLLVPPGDPRALADAVWQVLDDTDLARSLAGAGRDSARSRFGVARYRERILELVLATRGR